MKTSGLMLDKAFLCSVMFSFWWPIVIFQFSISTVRQCLWTPDPSCFNPSPFYSHVSDTMGGAIRRIS